MCSTSEPPIKALILAYCFSKRFSIVRDKFTFKLINADILILLNCVGVSEKALDLDFDRTGLDFLWDVPETESVDWEDWKFLWFVRETIFGDEFFGIWVELILLDFFFSESAPKADVDHGVPVDKVHFGYESFDYKVQLISKIYISHSCN